MNIYATISIVLAGFALLWGFVRPRSWGARASALLRLSLLVAATAASIFASADSRNNLQRLRHRLAIVQEQNRKVHEMYNRVRGFSIDASGCPAQIDFDDTVTCTVIMKLNKDIMMATQTDRYDRYGDVDMQFVLGREKMFVSATLLGPSFDLVPLLSDKRFIGREPAGDNSRELSFDWLIHPRSSGAQTLAFQPRVQWERSGRTVAATVLKAETVRVMVARPYLTPELTVTLLNGLVTILASGTFILLLQALFPALRFGQTDRQPALTDVEPASHPGQHA